MATCFRDYWVIDRYHHDLDLFKVIFYGLYHGKSPSNDHLGELFLNYAPYLGGGIGGMLS